MIHCKKCMLPIRKGWRTKKPEKEIKNRDFKNFLKYKRGNMDVDEVIKYAEEWKNREIEFELKEVNNALVYR